MATACRNENFLGQVMGRLHASLLATTRRGRPSLAYRASMF
jgi:hypothetical protein